MISFDQAAAIVGDSARPLGSERIMIGESHRRVLAEPIIARVNSPPSDVSAMDGYAICGADLERLPTRLRVVGESFAGAGFQGDISPGSCIRIFTGAPVPGGSNRVVIQEMVRREEDFALIDEHPGEATHVRRIGSDFRHGARLLEPGTRLGYRQLIAAAGADVAEVEVWRRPVIVVLGTGDELAEPGSAAAMAGTIPESVTFGVAALAAEWGAEIRGRHRVRDDLEEMERVAAHALDHADVIVVTGGASVGEKDFAKAMFDRHGLELLFSKVSIKPGKPVWLGRAKGKLIIGLPGNPTSALVTARLLLAPLIAGLSGLDPQAALRWREVTLLAPLPACGDRETFVRAKELPAGAEPVSSQDSSAQKALINADLLLRRRAGAEPAAAGNTVKAIEF